MVELQNVSVTYANSGVKALDEVSIKINDGDFVFVVGSSGAGKSTMIKLLLKEINATSGMVQVNGYNLNTLPNKKIPEFRRTLGFVFQDFRLIQSMTVYENIAFVLRVIDAPIKYIRKRVPYVIGLVGLTAKTNSYPRELSGGEMQRVAIARALVNDPQLIIADEPTGNIDPELSYEIVELLKNINDQGTTILMVTHEHDLVRHFGGRIINITDGHIVFDNIITGINDEYSIEDGLLIHNTPAIIENEISEEQKDYIQEESAEPEQIQQDEQENSSTEEMLIPEDVQNDIFEDIQESIDEQIPENVSVISEEIISESYPENDIPENNNDEVQETNEDIIQEIVQENNEEIQNYTTLSSSEDAFVDALVARITGEDDISLLINEVEQNANTLKNEVQGNEVDSE